MKRSPTTTCLGAALLLLTLSGCMQPMNYQTMMIPDLGLETTEEVIAWVAENISYVSDEAVHGKPDEWQLPHQTYTWRTGDCEDYALLALHLLAEAGIRATLELGTSQQGYGHAWVCVDGDHWEATSGYIVPSLPDRFPLWRYSLGYDEAMGAAAIRSVQPVANRL